MIKEVESYECQGCVYCTFQGDGPINECCKQHKCVPCYRTDGRMVKFIEVNEDEEDKARG